MLFSALMAVLAIYAMMFILIRRLRRTSLEFDSVGAEVTRQANQQLDSEIGSLSTASVMSKVTPSGFHTTDIGASNPNLQGVYSLSHGGHLDYQPQEPEEYRRRHSTRGSNSCIGGLEGSSLASVPYAGPGAAALSSDALSGLPHEERDHVSRFFAIVNKAPSPPPDYARALLSSPFIPALVGGFGLEQGSDAPISNVLTNTPELDHASPSSSSSFSPNSDFSSYSDTSSPAPAYTHFSTGSMSSVNLRRASGRVLTQTSASGPLDEAAVEAFLERARLTAVSGNSSREGTLQGCGLGSGRRYEYDGVEIPRRVKSRSSSASRH